MRTQGVLSSKQTHEVLGKSLTFHSEMDSGSQKQPSSEFQAAKLSKGTLQPTGQTLGPSGPPPQHASDVDTGGASNAAKWKRKKSTPCQSFFSPASIDNRTLKPPAATMATPITSPRKKSSLRPAHFQWKTEGLPLTQLTSAPGAWGWAQLCIGLQSLVLHPLRSGGGDY